MSFWNILKSKEKPNTQNESAKKEEYSSSEESNTEEELHTQNDDKYSQPAVETAETDSSQTKDDTERCSQHEKEMVQYFCGIHDCLGCGVCIMIEHRNCEGVIYIPKVAEEVPESNEYKDLENEQKALTEKSDNVINTSQGNLQKAKDNFSEAMQALQDFRKEKNAALDQLEDSIKTEAKACKAENWERMNKLLSLSAGTKNQIQQMKAEMETLAKEKLCCRLFIAMKKAKKQTSTITEDLEKLEQENFVKTYKFLPGKRKLEFIETPEDQEVIMVDIPMPSTSNGELGHKSKRQKITKEEDPKHLKANFLTEIYVKSETDTNIVCHIEGSVVLPGNRIVITDRRNCKVKLIDTLQKKVVSELKVPTAPHRVAIMTDGQVAVSLHGENSSNCNKILILKVDNSLIPDRLIELKKHTWFEGNIVYFKNQFIVIQDNTSQLQTITMSGDMASLDSENGSFVAIASNPKENAVYAVSVLYNSCEDSYWLKKTELNAELRSCQVTENMVPMDLFQVLHGVDQTGRVFILGSDSIHVMTNEQEPRILLTQVDGVFNPCSLCFDKETHKLYVGMCNSNNIRVYQFS